MFELLKRFNDAQVLTNAELFSLRDYLVEFESSAEESSTYFSAMEVYILIHGARMYLYSVNQVIQARQKA